MKLAIQNQPLFRWAALIVSLVTWLLFIQTVDRSDFNEMMLLFSTLFLAYGLFVFMAKDSNALWQGLVAAIVFRLIFISHIPELSDDFYRFIWDGRLLVHGLDPYAHPPSYYIEGAGNAQSIPSITPFLYNQLNSPAYFSIYPPVCQSIFALAGWLFPKDIPGSVIVIRSFILLFEFGSIYLLYRLQTANKWPIRTVLIYALNPLVIAELTGNLHFEAGMIFFLLGTYYFFQKGQLKLSVLTFAGSALTKLLPLALLPSLIRRIGLQKTLFYGLALFALTLLGFLPFISFETVKNLFDSINLYFQTFEFNAGIYYALRWLGELWAGYNLIAFIGPGLAMAALVLILFHAFKEQSPQINNWPGAIVIVLTLYLLFSTIVHPWYVTPLVAFGALRGYFFPLVWSFMVLMSYSAYGQEAVEVPLTCLVLEYGFLACFIGWDLRKAYKSS